MVLEVFWNSTSLSFDIFCSHSLWTQTGLVLSMCGCCENTDSKISKIVRKHCGTEINRNEKAKFFTAWLALLSIFVRGSSEVCVCTCARVHACVSAVIALAFGESTCVVSSVTNIGEGECIWISVNDNFIHGEKNIVICKQISLSSNLSSLNTPPALPHLLHFWLLVSDLLHQVGMF